MARKNLLTSLTAPKLTAVNSEEEALAPARQVALPFTGRGAVGAVTRSIEDLANKANAAKELEARLTSGQVVVELDPAVIDVSFMADRMAQDDAEYQVLKDSIAQSGQGSPILVRPHPVAAGRFQVAFGHRRLRAARDLEKPVRAVVRQLSDRDLVLAQGQENSARANLSFIERARFAHRLEESGYDRETTMLALSTDKTTVSRLVTVVQRIPAEVIDAIGPTAGTGRDRWVELANAFQQGRGLDQMTALLASEGFLSAGSDDRFQQVLNSLQASETPAPGRQREAAQTWHHSSGAQVLKLVKTDHATLMTIDNRLAPGFDAFLLERMEALYSTFLEGTGGARKARKRAGT